MRKAVGCLVAALILSVGGRAHAQVLTFNEMTPVGNPTFGTIVCGEATGFRFASDHFHHIGQVFPQDYSSNGTTYIGYESGRGFPIVMQRLGGGTFSLFSLDAAEFYSAPGERPDAETLRIVGNLQGGGTVTHTVTLDGLRDGPGGVVDFQHFVLPATFVNLTSVVFTGLRAGDLSGGVSVDNLEYQLSPPGVVDACVATPIPSPLPTVSIVSPAPGNVSGTVVIEAAASGSLAIASVQFRLNGVDLGAADVTAPYVLSWDSNTVLDGPHTLSAEVRDTSDNVSTASVVVTVRNHPVGTGTPHFVDLDGVDDYLQVGDSDAFSFGNGSADTPFTIEMWLRPDSLVRHQLVGKWGDDTSLEYKLHISSGVIRLDMRDMSAQASVSAHTTNNLAPLVGSWHHVAVTYDGRGGANASNGIAIYVDGIAAPLMRIPNAAYVAMENSTATLQIGRESPGWRQYDGGLDELRIWRAARTQSELQSSMTTELSGTEPGLAGYWRFNEGVGAIVNDDAPADHTAVLFNNPTWMAGGPLAPVEPDVTAPEISNVVIGNVTASGVTISFDTNETATGWVSYSTTPACPCTDVFSAGIGTAHTVTLTGLAGNTVHQFVVKATDAAGNLQIGPPMSFQTLIPPADAVPPIVSFVSPVAGSVSGTVQVEAGATDNIGVVSVQFRLDGVNLGAADGSAPYALSWDSTTVADGAHTLTADARDAANNVATASVVVNVQNQPVGTGTPHVVELDGLDDHAAVADADALSFGNATADTPFTIEMWLRPDAMGRHQLIGKWNDAVQEYKLYTASGIIRLDLRDTSAGATASAHTANTYTSLIGGWHHLAVTYDGRGGATAADGIAIYIDGVAVAMARIPNAAYVAMENSTATVQIGRESTMWRQYDGGLDDLRLWNVARTPSQIQAFRSSELTGAEAGLVAYWRFNEGVGATVSDDSPNSHTATLYNGPVWMAGGPLAPVEPDVTAPQISNIVTSNLTSSGVTISFTTNEPATGWVSYSATPACPCTDVFSAGVGTAHTVTLTGLAANTVHQFVVKATDAASNLQVGPGMSFQTLLPPSDATAPTVSFVTPAAGTVAGTVQVEASATDNVGVVNVQFRLDGVNLGAADTTAPYSVAWDSTAVGDGPHTLTAEARDAANNVATATVIVNTLNQPAGPSTPHFVDLDGVDDYAQVADANALSFGNGTADTPFTLEMWIRPDAMGRHQLVGKWNDSVQEYKLYLAFGIIRLDLRDTSAGATVAAYTANTYPSLVGGWHHLAATYDGRGGANAADGITIYIDGAAVAMTRIPNVAYVAMESSTATLQIGRESTMWRQYDGGLDDLRVWSLARTAGQIQSSMNVELAGTEAGLVAYWRFNEGAGTSVADDSPNSHTATLFNAPAWMSGGPLAPAEPDATAPQITNVVTSGLTTSDLTVSFNTSEPATGWVTYSAGASCPCTDVYSAAAGTAHVITLTGLTAATAYQLTPKAIDPSGNLRVGTPVSVQTPSAPADAAPPTVSFVSPAAGSVSASVTIEALASDGVGVASVQFKVDGVNLGPADTTAPYSIAWDSTTVADGAHTLTAEARDAANNVATASVVVNVQNQPAGPSAPHYVDLDGVDDYAAVADSNALSFGNGAADSAFTIEMWLRPDAMGRQQLIGKWNDGVQEYKLYTASGVIRLDLRDTSAGATVSAHTAGTYTSLVGAWHHLAVTYDGRGGATAADGITMYIDGVSVPMVRMSNAAYVAMENSTATLQIGRESTMWRQYDGALDELRIWNVARTPSEIQAFRSTELSGAEAGLVAYWRFNEGAGTTVADDSPNSHTATLFNTPAWLPGGGSQP